MFVTRPLSMIIAATVGLGMLPGCVASPTGAAATQSTTGTQTAQDAASVSQADQTMTDMEIVGEQQGGMSTQALGIPQATADGMVSATAVVSGAPSARRLELNASVRAAVLTITLDQKQAILQRAQALRTKTSTRLKALGEAAKQGMTKASVANEFGGQTVTMTFDFTAPNGGTHKMSMVRAYNGDKVLVSAVTTLDRTGKNGLTMHMERTSELQVGGGYKVHTETTQTLPNGQSRSATWDKVIEANGNVTGTGTLTRLNGTTVTKTLTITLSGTEEKTVTVAIDVDSKTSAKIEPTAEAGTDTSATVTVAGSGSTEITVGADLEATATVTVS